MNLSETSEVLASMADLRERGRRMALATIVSVRGSTYRRPGARLLVPDDGEPVGNLSGGCLEGEVEVVAREVMYEGKPRLVFYDLTADDEVLWGWGLGCNGAIEVLVEPADKAADVARALQAAIHEQRPVAVATVLEPTEAGLEAGARLLVHDDGRREGDLEGHAADVVHRATMRALRSGVTHVHRIATGDATARVFIEVLQPPLRLVLCGAGPDAIPLVRLASRLGWRVLVVDDREAMLDPGRFPGAELLNQDPAKAAEAVNADGGTYVVVMSHNYLRDRDYLRSFLESPVAYLGMLGPRARLERLLDDLANEGVLPSREALDRVHGPAGLDIGGEGPEEIAAAIVAEILAVSRARGGGFLRDRSAPIHDRQPIRS
jgi:xanthine dehydrogenase accessory factor